MSEKTLKIRLFGDSENESTEHDLPAKFEVCGRCEGYGTHLTPSIAEQCKGARVVLQIDSEACKTAGFADVLRQFRKQEAERERSEAEDGATMRGECGWIDC